MVLERSRRFCLLCDRPFQGRTFLCHECSDRYRDTTIPLEIRQRFYEMLDIVYPERSNTFGAYNEPAALLDAIKKLPRQIRILEVGAGGGFLAQQLHAAGFENLTLTDFTSSTLQEIHARVPPASLVAANAAYLPFKAASFEIIISSDLIEHLPDAERHIQEARRVLVPGGLYLLKTPNRLMAEAFYRMLDIHDSYFWHPSMYSPTELREAFTQHGFELRFLRPETITNAQAAKLPGPDVLRPVLQNFPVKYIPMTFQPHLEAIARKG